jgi:hypothetical protein
METTQIFHHAKNHYLQKNPQKNKETKNPSRYYNSIINNSSQVSTQAKISSFKNPHIKIDLLLLPNLGTKIP